MDPRRVKARELRYLAPKLKGLGDRVSEFADYLSVEDADPQELRSDFDGVLAVLNQHRRFLDMLDAALAPATGQDALAAFHSEIGARRQDAPRVTATDPRP